MFRSAVYLFSIQVVYKQYYKQLRKVEKICEEILKDRFVHVVPTGCLCPHATMPQTCHWVYGSPSHLGLSYHDLFYL